MISYEIPMGFAVIGVVMLAPIHEPARHRAAQTRRLEYRLSADRIFRVLRRRTCRSAANSFRLAEAEGDLGAGFHTEYSGIRFALFMVSEYVVMVLVSSLP